MTIHYLNQRHACLPSLCATCKYSSRRRCSTGETKTQAACARSLYHDDDDGGRGWWLLCHPANSILPAFYRARNVPKIRECRRCSMIECPTPLCDWCCDKKCCPRLTCYLFADPTFHALWFHVLRLCSANPN